ncbi:MAG: hypothetical protein R3B47_02495 [Bacteroidia bacterium]
MEELPCGYLGLFLMSASYMGIGLFASSLTDNQIQALLLGLAFGILFHWIFGLIAGSTTGLLASVASSLRHELSLRKHGPWRHRHQGCGLLLSPAFGGTLLTEILLNKHNLTTK